MFIEWWEIELEGWDDCLQAVRRNYSGNPSKAAVLAPSDYLAGLSDIMMFDCDGATDDDHAVMKPADIVDLCFKYRFSELLAMSADCYLMAAEAARAANGEIRNLAVRRVIREGDCRASHNEGTRIETKIAEAVFKDETMAGPALLILDLIGSRLMFSATNFGEKVKSNRPYEDYVNLVIPQLNMRRPLSGIYFLSSKVANKFRSDERLSQFRNIMKVIVSDPTEGRLARWEAKRKLAEEMLQRVEKQDRKGWLGRILG